MSINEEVLKKYLEGKFEGKKIKRINIGPLGRGCIGIGYLVEFEIEGKKYRKVLKSLHSEHMGSEYPADRAQSLLLAHHTYNKMGNHIRSLDVIGTCENGRLLPIGEAQEFYILMDEAKGKDFFDDIKRIAKENVFSKTDEQKIIALAEFLAKIHRRRHKSETLYKRKIRDTIGSGVSIMGVLDMYPEDLKWFRKEKQAELVGKVVEHWAGEKHLSHRLCEVHGDFHPGNIWFNDNLNFTLLDRSRGEYGEAADDLTAFLINFIFYSLIYQNSFEGALSRLFYLFIDKYFELTKDEEMSKVISPYWAFRTVVVCNPHAYFYPDSFFESKEKALLVRKKMINFAFNVLEAKKFSWKKIKVYAS